MPNSGIHWGSGREVHHIPVTGPGGARTVSPDLKSRLEEINAQINEKNAEAQTKWMAFDNVRNKVKSGTADPNSPEFKAAEKIHHEYAQAAGELAGLENLRNSLFTQLTAQPTGLGGKSIGQTAIESWGYQELKQSGVLESDRRHFEAKLAQLNGAETKALITGLSDTSGGAFITSQRAGAVAYPRRESRVLDLVSIGETSVDAIEYARQTTWTNVAAETAEATDASTGTKPEASMAFEKATATVRTIAHCLQSTRRSLADVPQLQALIDSQLRYGITLRLEEQIINGNGTGENFTGILNTAGILSQAKGADSVADAVHKAITQLRVGNINPTGVALHPTDWELIRLSKAAGSGEYLHGAPAESGPDTLWGLPVVVSASIPDDTALVGDWTQAMLWIREGIQVLATDSHEDTFVKNIVTVLAEGRFAFSVLTPSAWCKVTGVD